MINCLYLENFRNILHADIELAEGINLFYGPNGAGKTNILEAIGWFSLGKSCRDAKDKAMVNFNASVAEISASITNQKKSLIYLSA